MSTETGNPHTSRRINLKDVKEAPSVSADSVGMELRAVRLQRGETIAQISQVLRIRKDMVEALEHGRHDLLPGQAYEIGFMRAYADHLRLDTADVVRRYKAEMNAMGQPAHLSVMVPEEEQRFSLVSVLIILVCIGLAGGGAWYLAKQQGWIGGSRSVGAAPVVESDNTATSTTPAPDALEPAPATPSVATEPVPAGTPTTEPSAPPTAVAAPPPVAAVPMQPVETQPAAAAPASALPGGIVAPAAGEQAQAPNGREMGKTNSDARIVFIARRPALLSLSSKTLANTLYVNRTFQVGDSYRVPNKDGLVLAMSDAGAFDVMLDGQFIGHAGADGAVVKDFALSPEAYGGAPLHKPAPAATPPASPPVATAPGPSTGMPAPAPAIPKPVPAKPVLTKPVPAKPPVATQPPPTEPVPD